MLAIFQRRTEFMRSTRKEGNDDSLIAPAMEKDIPVWQENYLEEPAHRRLLRIIHRLLDFFRRSSLVHM